jgi:hypothetical protein
VVLAGQPFGSQPSHQLDADQRKYMVIQKETGEYDNK